MQNAKLNNTNARNLSAVCSEQEETHSNTCQCIKTWWTRFGESQGHLDSLKPRGGPSLKDSSDATSTPMPEICVWQKKCDTLRFCKLRCQNAGFSETHQKLYYLAKCVGVTVFWWKWGVTGYLCCDDHGVWLGNCVVKNMGWDWVIARRVRGS